ncbi:GNAT family protein [Alkalihalophilus pseudofirmus]|uniref:GNAT family N-acetyltransferase n=1 Tax=Alkalihalophilus pseudofirmus TaxID=79885 RepID=UPI00259BCDBC|nr:GNAT family protein [Alkalihalophilus pseudofirmus]WEG18830.1 GNAT family protein [Alkalihalophilus pseudofirmus]
MLRSKRIHLRKVTEGDVELYHSWRNDVEVMKTTSPYIDSYTLEETRNFVQHILIGSVDSKSYMIVDISSGETLGIISLVQLDMKNRNAECIIDIGNKEYWGKGYAKEALTVLLDYAFYEVNLHRISLKVYSMNEKAIHLYKKLGFKEEGVSREVLFREGKWHDLIHMGVLSGEYSNNK